MVRKFHSNTRQLRAAYLSELLVRLFGALVRLVHGPRAAPSTPRIQHWRPSQAAGLWPAFRRHRLLKTTAAGCSR